LDWDAARYHKLSDPQREWGLRVLERLAPKDGEWILDIGCGTGRLTAAIAAEAPRSRVVATDRSGEMLREAYSHFAKSVGFVQADGICLPFDEASFDAVFSTATFHWITDHDALFAEVHRVLRPGGRLVSQCGGGPNLHRLYRHARALRTSADYAPYFADWADPWHFSTTDQAASKMTNAGFRDIRISLEPAPTPFADIDSYKAFVTTVCLRHHVGRLPSELREPFVHTLAVAAAADDPPLTLDYWRLNIDGRRA
jgi:ubiquinone/menaquinone biosynthesis C-methylase UbiE